MSRVLVIHPHDSSTEFLSVIYRSNPVDSFVLMTEADSNSAISDAMMSDEFSRIMILGHGSELGLFARNGNDMFGRLIVSSHHVQFLRDREVIGIWCNANIFAEKYRLRGLFSGMVISEVSEALDLNVNSTEEEIMVHRQHWANHLADAIYQSRDNLEDAVRLMNSHINESSSYLESFNYESIYYFN